MAITTAPDRELFVEKIRFQGFCDATSEIVTNSDCWLTQLSVINTGSTDAFLTISDRAGTPVSLFSLYRVTASGTDRDTVIINAGENPVYMPNGFSILASSGAQLHVRGVYQR